MSELTHATRGGEFATSRKTRISEDFDFIVQKAKRGFPVAAIANMCGRSVQDVRLIVSASSIAAVPRPPVVLEPVAPPPPPVKPAPESWRVWREKARVKGARNMPAWARGIVEPIAKAHGLTMDELISSLCRKRLSAARHQAWATLHGTGRCSLPQIGSWFNGRDHTTILNGIRRHRERQPDPDLAAWQDLGQREAA